MADGKGKDACMLKFNSDARLTSAEFIKVFKEFDKDGKLRIRAFLIYRKFGDCGLRLCLNISSKS